MVRIMLKPSRLFLLAGLSGHVLAFAAVLASGLPLLPTALLLILIALSAGYHCLEALLLLPHSIRRLVLDHESCLSESTDVLQGRVIWGTRGFQVIRFRRDGRLRFGSFFSERSVMVFPDSCTPEEHKILRRFQQWQCCFQ